MLLQFSVENYLSFRNEVVLNMMPAKSQLLRNHILEDDAGKKTSCLPLAIVYGPNASGKTNLVNALDFVKNLVTNGTKSHDPTGTTGFRLDATIEHAPSRFEVVFRHAGVVYTYGFLLDSKVVHEEWLFAYYTSQESKVFERKTQDGEVIIEDGARLASNKKENQFIEFIGKGTRPNQLFLKEAEEKNVALLEPVSHWFREHLIIIRPQARYRGLVRQVHEDTGFADYLSEFLSKADTGIDSVRTESSEFDSDTNTDENSQKSLKINIKDILPDHIAKLLLANATPNTPDALEIVPKEDGSRVQLINLMTSHKRNDGSEIDFELAVESDGTRRLMNLAPMLPEMREHERVFVVDEIDRSLHTLLSRKLIEVFLNEITGGIIRGQCIFTTHDTRLLDRKILRKDEIWFTEKDSAGATQLTSLAEYRVSDGLNYENGYLHGRFGAIPDLHDMVDLS